jgi:hypothetical protein
LTPVPAAAAQARGSCISGVAVRRHGQDSTTFAARPPAAAAAQECRTFTRAVAREAGADFFQKIYTSIFFLKKQYINRKPRLKPDCVHTHTYRHTDTQTHHTYTRTHRPRLKRECLRAKCNCGAILHFFFWAPNFFSRFFFSHPDTGRG